jgi:hypothetical protein
MKVSNEQLVEGLTENGHRDVAELLEAKLEPEGDEQPRDMNQRIRSAAGREPAK